MRRVIKRAWGACVKQWFNFSVCYKCIDGLQRSSHVITSQTFGIVSDSQKLYLCHGVLAGGMFVREMYKTPKVTPRMHNLDPLSRVCCHDAKCPKKDTRNYHTYTPHSADFSFSALPPLTPFILRGQLRGTASDRSPLEEWRCWRLLIFCSTLQLHYNAVLYKADSIITRSPRGSQIFFQYNVWKCQQTIAVYTKQAVKIVLPVYFLARFDTS